MSKEIKLNTPTLGLGGEVKYKLWNEDGSLAYESDWSSNTILTNGLTIFSTVDGQNHNWYFAASVGTNGSATNPAVSTLISPIGYSSDEQPSLRSNGNEGSPDYEFWMVRAFRLAAGTGTGTIQEMGIGAGLNGTDLFARHVVSPPIEKSAAQVLDVFYKLTCWPTLIPVAGTALIGGVNYDTETSFYNVDAVSPLTFARYWLNTSASFQDVYDGIAATSTENTPQGNVGTSSTAGFNSTTGSGFRNVGYKLNLNDGVTATEVVRTATSQTSLASLFQTQFTSTDGPAIGTGIPKTLADELTLNFQLTWGERP